MKNYKLVAPLLILLMGCISNADSTMYRIQPVVDYRMFSAEGGGVKSQFSGFSSGLSVEVLSQEAEYRRSFLLGLESINMDNTANTGVLQENLNGLTYFVGARVYTRYFFIGLRVIAGQKNLDIKLPGSNTSRGYLDYGFGGELGTDYAIGKGFYVTPSVQYRFGNFEPKSSGSSSKKTIDTVLTVSLGYEF